MTRIALAAIAALTLAVSADARVVEKRQYGNWLYEYNLSDNVTSCVASRYYSNAQFSVRFYGDRMDVVFWRDDFAWPWDDTLGTAAIRVSGRTYRMRAGTAPRDGSGQRATGTMYLSVPQDKYDDFFFAVKRARRLDIELWNGTSYPVDLTGSSRSLDAALDCWSRRRTGS